MDEIPEKEVIDFTSNMYGNILIDFLINSNMCMLNGRKFTNNDLSQCQVKV